MYDGSVVFVGAVGACEGGCDVKSLWGFSVLAQVVMVVWCKVDSGVVSACMMVV
jgi:hypothetical protein